MIHGFDTHFHDLMAHPDCAQTDRSSLRIGLLAVCRGKIASFKIPRYVLCMREYPMTSSGKVQKFKLREMSMEALGLAASTAD